jgi:hypothetical protein
MKIEASRYFKTLISFHNTTRLHYPEMLRKIFGRNRGGGRGIIGRKNL